jgi:hypothetical protein
MRRILLLLLLGSCTGVRGVPHRAVASLAGCYALKRGGWSRPWNGEWNPPDTIRLDTALAPRGNPSDAALRRLRPQVTAFANSRGGGTLSWRFIPPDSVRLGWSGAYMNVSMQLEARDGELVGSALASTDVMMPRDSLPAAPIHGRRIACPASLGDPEGLQRR